MTKNDKQKFTRDYNGAPIQAGYKMVPFEYKELEAENYTNPECIKTIRKAGRSYKVVYKAVPEDWEKEAKSQFNLMQNEDLGHYDVSDAVSIDAQKDAYDLDLAAAPSSESVVLARYDMDEKVEKWSKLMENLIRQSPKLGYAMMLVATGSKGAEFAKKMKLGHDAANIIRASASEFLKACLLQKEPGEINCKNNKYTDYYREEAMKLMDDFLDLFD